MSVVTMKQLLEAGVHFGHQTKRWNPKMKRYIFSERNGIYIIDLQQTIRLIETSYEFIRDLVAGGGVVLFVGTKKQSQEAIKEEAIRCGMPYVSERWLGGLLTNFKTVTKRIEYLDDIEQKLNDPEFSASLTKKELAGMQNEYQKLLKNLGGIRTLKRVPEVLFVVDPKKEQIAVNEANKLDLPIVSVVDTNCDPDEVTHVIPGNDDAIRAAALITRVMANGVLEGKGIAESAAAEQKAAEEKAEAERKAREEAAKAAEAEKAAVQPALTEEIKVDKPAEAPAKKIDATEEKKEEKATKVPEAKKLIEEKATKEVIADKKDKKPDPAEKKGEEPKKKSSTASKTTKSSTKTDKEDKSKKKTEEKGTKDNAKEGE